MSRLTLPQPFEELDHTADVGVLVRGETAEETLARLVLALSQLLSGGGALEPSGSLELEIEPGDRASMAIDVLRELLYRFDCEGVIAANCHVLRFDPERGTTIMIDTAPYDPDRHAEGIELKAVTWHQALFLPEGDRWMAQIVFDV